MPTDTKNKQGVDAARVYVQRLRDECGGMKPFFKRVHGRDTVGNEHITFNNKVNRGNYSAEFVTLLAKKLALGGVTIGEFYGIDE